MYLRKRNIKLQESNFRKQFYNIKWHWVNPSFFYFTRLSHLIPSPLSI